MAVNRLPDPNGGIQPSTLTTTGDILYASSAQVAARLAIGSANQALGVSGGIPAYQASSKSTLTTTGDILYASAANTPARLGIGSASQVLSVSGGIPAWTTPSAGAVTQITTGTFTSVTSKSVDNCFTSTYKNYSIIIEAASDAYTATAVTFRYRGSSTDGTANSYYGGYYRILQNGTTSTTFSNPATSVGIANISDTAHQSGTTINLTVNDPLTNGYGRPVVGLCQDTQQQVPGTIGFNYFGTITADGFTLLFAGASTGTYKIYGWSN